MMLSALLVYFASTQANALNYSQSCDFDFLGSHYLRAHNAFHTRETAEHTTASGAKVGVYVPAQSYDYPTITELLAGGVCGFEFDIYPRENNSLYDAEDFQVQHYYYWDDESSDGCTTLFECLTQISDWITAMSTGEYLETEIISCPIKIDLQLALPIADYPDEDLLAINDIVGAAFNITQLYTPASHGALPTDEHWPNWLDGNGGYTINPGQAFVTLNDPFFRALFEGSNGSVSTIDVSADYVEYDSNIFPRCGTPLDLRYCVVCQGDITLNDTWRDEYVWQAKVGLTSNKVTIQDLKYPLMDKSHIGSLSANTQYPDDSSKFVQLPDDITNAMNLLWDSQNLDSQVPFFGYSAGLIPLLRNGTVPWTWWNAWSIFAFIDAKGNNNGKIDTIEVMNFVYETNQRDVTKRALAQGLMTTPLSSVNAFFGTLPAPNKNWILNELPIDGAFLWMAGALILDGDDFTEIVPLIETSNLESTTCQAIAKGYHYISSDFPYKLSTNFQNRPWAFTVRGTLCNDSMPAWFTPTECVPTTTSVPATTSNTSTSEMYSDTITDGEGDDVESLSFMGGAMFSIIFWIIA